MRLTSKGSGVAAGGNLLFWRNGMIAVTSCFMILLPCILYDLNTFRYRHVVRRRVSKVVWQRVEACKLALPKDSTYQNMTAEQLQQQLPIWVISLRRAAMRRANMTQQLKQAGITNHELVDAVDATDDSSTTPQEVHRYISGARYRLWLEGQTFQRGKVAIDLSHFRLLQRVVKLNKTAVILEDDAELTPSSNWYGDLLAALQKLPDDWQVLYLNGCFACVGVTMGSHVAALRSSVCALGLVVKPAFATIALSEAQDSRRGSVLVDMLYEILIRHREVQAYICQPPLVQFSSRPSTIDYAARYTNVSWWDSHFTEGGHRRRTTAVKAELMTASHLSANQ